MENGKNTRSYSAADLAARRAGGESQTDLVRVRARTQRELAQDIAADAAFQGVPKDWYKAAKAVMPTPKILLSLRLDAEVVDWFRQQGPGYQTRMNAVLRAFVERGGRTTKAGSRGTG